MAVTQITELEAAGIPLAVPRFANFALTSGTADLEIVAALGSKRIVVLAWHESHSAANQMASMYSGASAGGDLVFPGMILLANNPVIYTFKKGIFATEAGDALVMKPLISGATSEITGHLTYVYI